MSRLNVGKLIASLGVRLPSFTDATRPAGETGLLIYNSEQGFVEVYNGEEWANAARGSFTVEATGGNIYTSATHTYHVFDGPGTFGITQAKPGTTCDVLVVAGGGSGGVHYYNGGGGAGGVVHVQNFPIQALGTGVTVTVGAGGTYPRGNGLPSSFGSFLSATGGGCGGGGPRGGPAGEPGGSGGGGSLYRSTSGTGLQPQVSQSAGSGSLTVNSGYPGGPGPGWPGSPPGGGGGGGAGSSGQPWQPSGAGDGGVGVEIPGFTAADHPALAASGRYGGGGGGGTYSPNATPRRAYGGVHPGGSPANPQGLRYGGGNGGSNGPAANGFGSQPGLAKTGGGAGGPDYPHTCNGGSGVVAVRYAN